MTNQKRRYKSSAVEFGIIWGRGVRLHHCFIANCLLCHVSYFGKLHCNGHVSYFICKHTLILGRL